MDHRYSSSSSRAASPQPKMFRKRSNSFPIVDALGCSTPEAELMLAEGRAAVRTRHAAMQRRNRRNRSDQDDARTFDPRDHLKFLAAKEEGEQETSENRPLHSRVLSSSTDRSTATVTGPLASPNSQPPRSPASPLGDYSANLARFVKAQLSSIPTFEQPILLPSSGPELPLDLMTPVPSPTVADRRASHISRVIEIPSVRPPLLSAFSAWSSTDDDTDDDYPPMPNSGSTAKDAKYTPSLLRYYETSNSSFFFTSTPLDEDDSSHPNARNFSYPRTPQDSSTSQVHTSDNEADENDYPSSALSNQPQLTSSSAPSFSSISTASYFDCKRPLNIPPHIRDKIVAAVSPRASIPKSLPAASPLEDNTLANVHDMLTESQHRILVDGLSFDLVNDMNMPEDMTRQAAPHVTTSC